jgi:flavodoxin/ferredoxin
MKILLLYYSGAGNTKLFASIIEKVLIERKHTVKSVKITESSINSLDNDFNVLYIGFPTYFRAAPDLIFKALDKLSGNNRQLMTFMSRGLYSGNTFRDFHKKAMEKEFIPIGFINLFTPGPDLLTSAIKENSFLEKIYMNIHSRNIYKKINRFVDKMSEGEAIKFVHKKWYTFLDEFIVKKAEIKANNAYKDWIGKFWANKENCTQCMNCVKGCPRNNIYFDNGITFGKNCDVCLYCICNCPKHAINISQMTVGKVKQSEEKIRKVFEKEMHRQTGA